MILSPHDSVRCFKSVFICVYLWLSLSAFAHDPYEITSTLSLYSNRTELNVELEFRAGALLTGHFERIEAAAQPALFETIRPALIEHAAKFFRLSLADNELRAERAEVALGVENHIRFKISYPPLTNQSFSLDAPGLKFLSDQGPYGVSFTALDMQNKLVLGQSVLFATSPPAEFNPVKDTRAQSASDPNPIRLERSSLVPEPHASQSPKLSLPAPAARRAQEIPILPIVAALVLICAFGWFLFHRRKEHRA